ncbi:hypothetical protein Val02_82090 [Virgisporangium aliadipatigenens]|uniref:Uncharacterized protein n=1 Tax=Virgisporangium aliadipatigenens TaxID=741659 RepID=A0A8J3YXA0_9ACTN|nr:hypothetical protein [Virgisporangium aliadipatigenens]GIJ51323.1 hypothetical protein Val02_82090 [Virgisporangium aliadipatigenens]
MTAMVLKAAYAALATVNYSAQIKKAELKAEVEDKDVTTFASLGWMEYKGGLFKAGLSLSFLNDYTDNGLDEAMWTAFLAGDPIAFEVRAANATVTASNPKWTGLVLVKEWSPLSGSVGDVAGHDVSWPTSGVVTRGVS